MQGRCKDKVCLEVDEDEAFKFCFKDLDPRELEGENKRVKEGVCTQKYGLHMHLILGDFISCSIHRR
jgi:hypothetical protein